MKVKRYTFVKKQNFWHTLKEFIIITLGAAVVASTVFFFMLPSQVAIGSASALAMVLNNLIPTVPISVFNLIINVVLLGVGFILIGPEFGAKTVYTTIIIPIFMWILEQVFPNFTSLTNDPLLDVLCHLLIVSLGMAILFSCNASSGGLDIVAKILNKYTHMDIGTAVSVSGVVVAASSFFFYDTKIAVVSILGTYFGGMVVDKFIFGLNIKRRVCVISERLDEIVQFVLHDLHSGATINEIIGAYDMTRRREVIVIVNKQEYKRLMDYVKKLDPKAFVTVYAVNEIRYQPKVKQIKK